MAKISITTADKWFSKAVRMRDKCCVVCGKTEGLECCHVYGRRQKILRWSLDNAVTMCHYHHRYYTEQPIEWFYFLETLLGSGHMELLKEKRRGFLKDNEITRKEVSDHYRVQVKEAESDPHFEFVSYN